MKTTAAVLAAVAAVAAAQHSYDPTECSVDFGNATFNLNDFAGVPLGDLQDATNAGVESDWYYNAAICSNVIPSAQYKCGRAGLAGAYQINKRSRDCHPLSGDVQRPGVATWGLLNPADPAAGLSLTYTGGDGCSGFDRNGHPTSTNRSVRFDFICDAAPLSAIPQNLTIIETAQCQYNLVIKSALGCPEQCPFTQPALGRKFMCGQHGVCDYNAKTSKAACFCNTGHSGSDCSRSGDAGPAPVPNHSGQIVGGLFGGVFGGVVLALGGYFVYMRMHGGGGSGGGGSGYAGTQSYAQLDGDGAAPTGDAMFTGSAAAPIDSGAGGYVAPDDGGPLVS